jgi:hypothetical protein
MFEPAPKHLKSKTRLKRRVLLLVLNTASLRGGFLPGVLFRELYRF